MAFEVKPFPEFSWSQSRRSTFKECPRKYFYQYYASHNGWLDEANAESKVTYRLKNITNLHLYCGSVIHDLASMAINYARSGSAPMVLDDLIQTGRNYLNGAYAQSQRRDEWKRRPNRLVMFHEFYYNSGPSDELIKRIRDKVVTCLTNLLNSQSYREALQAPYVEVKETDRPAFFLLNDHKIYAQPDLLYRKGNGEYRIVDWKTGREEELHFRQLRTYALYVKSRFQEDLKPGTMVGCLEYLFGADNTAAPITDEECEEERREILDSIAMMQEYLANAQTNEPLPREEFSLRPDTDACRYCKFYELNKQEIEKPPSGPF